MLEKFDGGHVVVGVVSTPFKCRTRPQRDPALLLHDYLTRSGLRERSEISLVMPLPVPIPPSPPASEALLTAFTDREIAWYPNRLVKKSWLPAKRFWLMRRRDALQPSISFLGVPVHRVPQVVADSGMTVDGWIPVNPLTLETVYPQVFAVGDVTKCRHTQGGRVFRTPSFSRGRSNNRHHQGRSGIRSI